MPHSSKTDWARIDAMADDDIDTSDIPPLDTDFFENAELRLPHQPQQVSVTIAVDADVVAWYQAQGTEGLQRMNAALRIYANAHRFG